MPDTVKSYIEGVRTLLAYPEREDILPVLDRATVNACRPLS